MWWIEPQQRLHTKKPANRGKEGTRTRTHRVSNLQAGAGLEARDELTVQTAGVEGQRQLLRDALQLQLHLGANFLATAKSFKGIFKKVATATTWSLFFSFAT